MRIVAGRCKGARIYAPRGLETRPTSDRVREAAFDLIGPLEGAAVLDLFAGSGALGLEALSRGAASAVFVDAEPAACRAIERNLAKLRLDARVVCADASRYLARERSRYDLVLLDPPYELLESLLVRHDPDLARVVADGGLLVVESAAHAEPELPSLRTRTSRRYGAARLTLFERP